MSAKMTWHKIVILSALIAAPLFLANCGSDGSEHVATQTVGPTGPTSPSGYYFEVTASPHTIPVGGGVVLSVRVWDENGNAAGDAWGAWSITGVLSFDGASGLFITDTNGYSYFAYEFKDWSVTGTTYITVIIEDAVLQVPVTIIGPDQAAV